MSSETILLASFMHESNTFVKNPETTSIQNFRQRREYKGQAVIEEMRGTETHVGGVIDVAESVDVDLRPVAAVSATPGAPVSEDAYETYTDLILDGVREHASDIDGVILPLHGAMVPEHLDDGEGPLIKAVRDIVDDAVPISVCLDLHGHITEEMMTYANSINGYKEYPHLDKADAGRVGMQILLKMIRGEAKPTMHIERPPQIIFQPKAYTPSGPMRELMDRTREYEERDDVLAANIFVGFYHADIPEMGVSTPVVTDDDPELAQKISRDLAETLWSRRTEFVEEYPGPEDAVAEAKNIAAQNDADAGPVVMGDFGSNPGGGGASDGTTVPRALLAQNVPNAGYAVMYDPEVAASAVAAGVGETLTITLGGKTDDQHGDPISNLSAYVKAVTDGRFTNRGTSHTGYGTKNNMGPTAHLECGPERDLHVIVSGIRQSAFDAEVWRHIGIQPERLDVLCIPSFIAFLGDYEPFSSAVVLADTPGASAVNPARFEYEHIPRPLYPLDDLPSDAY